MSHSMLIQRARVWRYRRLWTCGQLSGSPKLWQPALFLGPGRIVLGEEVEFGWPTSGGFYSGYCHVEASTHDALIEIGDRAQINNDAVLKSEGAGIHIGERALIGSHACIYDSDFHELAPSRRRGGRAAMAPVELEENVFLGDRVLVLKGVTIGMDSVIGAGSVVTGSIPAGVLAAGNPARVIREL
jgi:acetyltransferase-like isoleucine patch superfamily enzyme